MQTERLKIRKKMMGKGEAPKPFFFEHSNLVAAAMEGDDGSRGIEFYAKDLGQHHHMDIMQDDMPQFLQWLSSVSIWMNLSKRNKQ